MNSTNNKSSDTPCSQDYAYKDIEEFEEIVGYKAGAEFRYAWNMARTTNAQIGIFPIKNSVEISDGTKS